MFFFLRIFLYLLFVYVYLKSILEEKLNWERSGYSCVNDPRLKCYVPGVRYLSIFIFDFNFGIE